MSRYVQAHDAVIAHFVSTPTPHLQMQSNGASRLSPAATSPSKSAAAVSSSVAQPVAHLSSAFGPTFLPHHPLPPPHMLPHPAFPPPHPMPYMMYGPPPHPMSAYHPLPPPMHPLPPPPPPSTLASHSAMYPQPAPAQPASNTSAISMVEACQLATQSVKPALDRYRSTHASAFLQSASNNTNHASAHSPTARALLASLKRDEVKRGRKRAFQRVSGDVEAETESEGMSDDESMGSASSWSAVDDEAENEDTRAAQAAQLIASLSQSPGSKRTTVKLEHDPHPHSTAGSRLIRLASPIPMPVFDSTSLLNNKHLKHASVLVLYQAKEEQRPPSGSLPSTPASLAPSSSPTSPVHSMVLSPASSAVSSPATPSSKSMALQAPSFSPRRASSSSHATTAHAAHPPAQASVALAAASVPASAPLPAITPAHYLASPATKLRSRLTIPVMRERRRRRRRVGPVSAVTPGFTLPGSSFQVAAAIPAMPVTAASPAKPVMAAISYVPTANGTIQQQPPAGLSGSTTPVKEKDEKRTYNGKIRVYHNVPVNLRTGRVSMNF